ncbi:MAG: hypothetical protein SNI32_06285 [Rikenellaceae bacterium]
MSGVRIKDLQSGAPLVEEHFDQMEFVVDSPATDSTLRLSGEELKEAVGLQKHTHPLTDVEGLVGELDKKLNRSGGTISGDLRVDGHSSMKSLSVDEYLEVPEIKYNRITATGNEFWFTDAGVVDDVWEDSDGIFLVTLKASEDESTTINFEQDDILRGVFYTTQNDMLTGFSLAFFRVVRIIDSLHFDCVTINGVAPERFMTLARQGNSSNSKRQGSIYLDGLNRWIRVLDAVTGEEITQDNIKVQLGDLSQVNHPIFGQLDGYGALLENAYISGRLVQHDPTTGEDWAVGAVSVSGEQQFCYDKLGTPDKEFITLTATEQGFTSAESSRKWQYNSGTEWVDIEGVTSLSFELRHDNAIWGDRQSLSLRYIAYSIYYDIITISKLYDGQSSYQVQIISLNGTNFINSDISTELKARLYRDSEDITATLDDAAFSWVRLSDDTTGDTDWNELHVGVGSLISITGDDLFRKATFNCNITIN